jgi:hypothetical protein
MGECLGGYGVMGVYGGPNVVEDGLVLALDGGNSKSYPGSGTTWSDLSGNGNNGTLVNGVGYNSGNLGSLVFDGVDDYVDLGSEKTFKSSGGWTVSSWNNLSQVNSANLYNFIGSTNIVHNSWYWTVYQSKLALWNRSPGGWYFGSTTIQPNIWYNSVLVCNDSGTSYQMYLNGIAEGGTHTTYTWNALYAGLIVRYIGRGNAANGRYFYGKYPQVSIYNRALTASEIQQNFIATRSRFSI